MHVATNNFIPNRCVDVLFSPKYNRKRQADKRKEWADMKINGTQNARGISECRWHETYVPHE
jgi:hypothetical protein